MTGLEPAPRLVLAIGVKPITQTLGCPGSDRTERSSQPRLIALSIVPNYLSEPASSFRQIVQRYLPERLGGVPSILSKNGQLNTLQTAVQIDHISRREAADLFRSTEQENNGQAARLISTSQLNASRRFHIWPINLVVYQEPSEVLRPGRSHLVEGFTLRCFQHFSHPDVATRRCRWRDNRYTRGSSNPVLSY